MANVLKLDLDCTPELLEKARKELRETDDVKAQAIEELKALLKDEPGLYYATTDDVLCRYLRPTKFYAKSALELMKREANFKQENKKILKDLMPENVKEAMLNVAPVNVLKNRDQEGRRILIQYAGDKWNPSKFPTDNIFQIFYLIHQAALLEPSTQINGCVVILDFKNLGLKQVANLTIPFAKLLLTFIQKAMPLRLKGVHIVNEPFLFKAVWKIFQTFIEEKLKSRLFFHGSDKKSLQKHINPECLPECYGGTQGEIDYSSADWYPILQSVSDVIKENNTYGIVEKS